MGKNKKTREQKIISDLRRKLALRQASAFTKVSADKQGETTHSSAPSEKKTTLSILQIVKETAFKIPAQVERKPVTTYAFGNYSHLASDLKKVGILTGLAILAQTVLYLALR